MTSILDNLNPSQQEAVTYSGGPLLVLAGAGSGKTKVLVSRVAYLIKSKTANPESVALLTFTNKAAGEMKERVASLIGSVPAFSGTFHSFCAKLLRLEGKEIGIPPSFVIYDETDQLDAIKEILSQLNLSTSIYKPSAVASVISAAKGECLTPIQFAGVAKGDWQEKVFTIYEEYEKLLKKNGALDFDDLLLKAVGLFENSPPVLAKWQEKLAFVLVDEWQDTNKIQYKLTQLLVGERKNITAVGDISQSIYRWRGADYKNINYLIRDFPEIKIINLEQNYRSSQNILDAANSIITKNTTHPVLRLWTNKGRGEKIKIYQATSELDEASFVASQVALLTGQSFSFRDFAVLYRTNAQSRVIEEAFLHKGIPYTLVGGVRFYERAEIKDLLSYLRLLANPKDSVSVKRALKIGKRRYFLFEEFKKEIQDLSGFTTLELLESVTSRTKYLDRFNKDIEEDYSRLENIKELSSVATQFPNIFDFLENVALVEGGYRLGKRDGVNLMTIHSAKGLEFRTVFIVGLEEGLFPHSRSLFDKDELEEERRLAYVATTRAKDKLYLTWAERRLFFGTRSSNPVSRFVIDIPENLLESPLAFPGDFLDLEGDYRL